MDYSALKKSTLFLGIPADQLCDDLEGVPHHIQYYDKGEKSLYIRVYKKETEAGFFAKLIISILGYSFCQGFIKPDVTEEDIEKYKHRFSLQK